jgi:hypothetical protein
MGKFIGVEKNFTVQLSESELLCIKELIDNFKRDAPNFKELSSLKELIANCLTEPIKIGKRELEINFNDSKTHEPLIIGERISGKEENESTSKVAGFIQGETSQLKEEPVLKTMRISEK